MAIGLVSKTDAAALARVFPIVGEHGRVAWEYLVQEAPLNVAASARQAEILLIIGRTRPEDDAALVRLHDQIPPPRASLLWKTPRLPVLSEAKRIADGEDPIYAIEASAKALRSGALAGEPDLGDNIPPAPWKGKGDHGQGGVGMMGGVPYGRPMAMTADDLRDGLALDPYTASFGPYLSHWPPGLVLDLTLQGDVIQRASVRRPPHEQGPLADTPLRLIARVLMLLGQQAHASRFLRAAQSLDAGESITLTPLSRRLRWSGAIAAIPPGLGGEEGGVRARLQSLWHSVERGQAPPQTDPAALGSLPDHLLGLEWCEAMLVLNSLETETLRSMALRAPTSAEARP